MSFHGSTRVRQGGGSHTRCTPPVAAAALPLGRHATRPARWLAAPAASHPPLLASARHGWCATAPAGAPQEGAPLLALRRCSRPCGSPFQLASPLASFPLAAGPRQRQPPRKPAPGQEAQYRGRRSRSHSRQSKDGSLVARLLTSCQTLRAWASPAPPPRQRKVLLTSRPNSRHRGNRNSGSRPGRSSARLSSSSSSSRHPPLAPASLELSHSGAASGSRCSRLAAPFSNRPSPRLPAAATATPRTAGAWLLPPSGQAPPHSAQGPLLTFAAHSSPLPARPSSQRCQAPQQAQQVHRPRPSTAARSVGRRLQY